MIDTDFHKLDPRKSIVFLPMDGQFKQDVGANLVTNGDFEAGTTGWTPSASVLSVNTVDPYDGTQCLRVTQDGSNGNARAYGSAVGSAGKQVHGRVWAKGDGVTRARVYLGTEFLYYGALDVNPWPTSWTLIDAVATGGDEFNVYAYLNPTVAGPYLEFDGADLRERPQVTRSLSLTTGANDYARLGTGHLSTAYPTSLSPRGLSFDGGDYINLDWSAGSALDTQTFTFVMYGKPTTPVADDRIYEIGIAGQRYSLYFDLSAGNLVCWKDDTVDKTIVTAKGYPDGQEHVYAFSFSVNGMNLYVDGELEGSILGDVRLASFNASTKAYIGQDVAGGNQYNGNMYSVAIYDFELTNVQIRECGRRMIQMRNI